MDAQEVLGRLPMAEATLRMVNGILEPSFLDPWYEENRERTYCRELTFAEVVGVMRDCLMVNTSVNHHWRHHKSDLDPTVQAYYQKLKNLPVGLSERFLSATTERLKELVQPESLREVPLGLKDLRPVIVDARTIKHVAKRLLPTRALAGAALGGKTLAALDYGTGLIEAFSAATDGDANETTLLEGLLKQLKLKSDVLRPYLFIADRQYGDLTQPRRFAEVGEYLIRVPKRLTFEADAARPARHYRDTEGREVVEEWGWLGRTNKLEVRRLTVRRDGRDDVAVVTSLLDGDQHPALSLLELYRQRWSIEDVFRELVQVFGLERLIGSHPQAMIFQTSFCMFLYNVLQGQRQIVAKAHAIDLEIISTTKMFDRVQRSLTALFELLEPPDYLPLVSGARSWDELRKQLTDCLNRAWHPYWLKRKPGKPNPRRQRPKKSGAHFSVQRVLDEHAAKKKQAKVAAKGV